MAQAKSTPFFNTAVSAWNKVSRSTQLLALCSGFLTSASSLMAWLAFAPSFLVLWIGGSIAVLIGSFVTYLIVRDLTDGEALHVIDWLWLGGSTLALVLPFGMAFAAAYSLKMIFGTSVSGPAFVVMACLALLIMLFLPAWPVAQMRLRRLVSPWRVFQATKGYRRGLVLAYFVPSSIGQIIPPIKTSKSDSEALLRFLGEGFINTFVVLILGGIAATAWQFARLRDPALSNSDVRRP
jgi:hypothetical protein